MYKERMHKLKEELKTENDLKPTGRQIFLEMRKNIIEDLKIEEEEDAEAFKDEEGNDDDDEDEELNEDGEAIYYDRALYDQDL